MGFEMIENVKKREETISFIVMMGMVVTLIPLVLAGLVYIFISKGVGS